MAYVVGVKPATKEQLLAKIEVLEYLIYVASQTTGGEVWRSLFAEMRNSLAERVNASEPKEK